MWHLHFHNLTYHASMCRLLTICIYIFLETAVSFERNFVRMINRLFLIFCSKVAAIQHPIWNLLYTVFRVISAVDWQKLSSHTFC